MKPWPEWTCFAHNKPLEAGPEELPCPEGHIWPVVNGTPRFVAGATYADHLGAQWNRFPRTQLDSYTGFPITAERVRRCLGSALWESLCGKNVLECGCGAGRFTEVLLAQGARVTSIDLSSAVDANARNFPVGPNHRVAQADIMKTAVRRPQGFDAVLCL